MNWHRDGGLQVFQNVRRKGVQKELSVQMLRGRMGVEDGCSTGKYLKLNEGVVQLTV